ncbi:uncharacterized protein STEHIDRAFT_138057 [Stereum hirsutum FP-91666 SS1]|uniref:uncharacterized protein n=1 Tax=Stereum hirsutum (strain FP-91666) TaxID=721885 RepID=UPI000440A74E|nr:uncharacterized protein STEHIDRAFT_138057 [Stereum hirsutum FP-91666 SS1]EIM88907.1 hypothetical protein STEHIDRAFT_138057 [Stereum hirsutum FP-91666 SS1]
MTVRLLCFIKRLPHVSFEEFDHHWKNTHGKLVASLQPIVDGKITYTQLHVNPVASSTLQAATFPVISYDGIAEFHAETVEEILQLFGSQEYQEKVAFDEATLGFDRAAVQVMVGENHVPQPAK